MNNTVGSTRVGGGKGAGISPEIETFSSIVAANWTSSGKGAGISPEIETVLHCEAFPAHGTWQGSGHLA